VNNSLVIYLAIGSLFAGVASGYLRQECGPAFKGDPAEYISIVVGWPGIFTYSIFTHENSDICRGVEK